MTTITYKATLVYYDGPQVIEARDSIGGHYVGVLVEVEDGVERFAVVGVPPERLRAFRVGGIDLRELFSESPTSDWYLAAPGEFIEAPMELELQERPLSETSYLPDSGFYLHEQNAAHETLAEARKRNNLVMEIAVSPPEAAVSHRIRLTTLSKLLSEIQLLTKHAYKRAVREAPADLRKTLNLETGAMFDVIVPASAGSFRVALEASDDPDLLGQSELARALNLIDVLFESVSNPVLNLEVVREYKGHLAGAYIRLLRLLMESDTNLRYSWAEPGHPDVHLGSIGRAQAATLVRLFDREASLDREDVEYTGALSKADAKNQSWRLETEEGGISGTVHEEGPSLSGLTIGNAYRFNCIEQLTTTERGTEQRALYLVEHHELT